MTKNPTDLSFLFNEETSDEAKEKIKTVFEAAVEARSKELDEEREAKIEEIIEDRVADALSVFEETFDKYTSYVAETWLDENKLAVESALKVEIAESLMEGLAALFASHSMDIPEADGVVEGLVARNEELTAKLNEQVETNMVLNEKLDLIEVESKLDEICEGLPDTKAAKLKDLAENVKFKDIADFERKVRGIRETLFKEEKVENATASPSSDEAPPLVEEKKEAAPTGDPTVDAIVESVRRRV